MGVADVVLLMLTMACWFVALVSLSQVVGRDVHGDAVVAQAIAFFAALAFLGLTWLWLGGLLLMASAGGAMPASAHLAALLLYPASAAGAAAAIYLVQDPKQWWPVIVPALIPPITAGYVFALHRPELRALFAGRGSFAVGGVILLLSLAPWPSLFQTLARKSEQRAEHERAQQQWDIEEKARVRAENLLKLAAMSPDEPVMNWYGLLEDEGGVRAEAFEKLRHVPRRQADIEDMLSWGVPKAMMLLPDLDLAPTPQLCASAHAFLRKRVRDSAQGPTDEPAPYTSEGYVTESIAGIRWLISHGCDCDLSLAAIDAMVRTYKDSPERQKVLASLAELRRKS